MNFKFMLIKIAKLLATHVILREILKESYEILFTDVAF